MPWAFARQRAGIALTVDPLRNATGATDWSPPWDLVAFVPSTSGVSARG